MEDLDLTFSVSDAALGRSSSIDLIPGGSNIAVTSSNRYDYERVPNVFYFTVLLRLLLLLLQVVTI